MQPGVTTDIPASRAKPKRGGGRRGPGRFYLHGGARAEFARSVLAQLTPGRAVEVEVDDPAYLPALQALMHNVDRCSRSRERTPVRTRTRGDKRLVVWLREDDAQLRLL